MGKDYSTLKAGILIALMLMLGFQAGLPAQAQSVNVKVVRVYWGEDSPVQARPGDLNIPLTVIVENLDTVTINYLEAKLKLAGTPFSNPVHKSEAYSGASSILPGGMASLVFHLNIDEEAELKTYTVPLELTVFTSKYASGVSVELNVPIPLYGEVQISASLSPAEIQPGKREILVRLENRGEAEASSLKVTISPVSPLALAEGDGYFDVGSLPASASTEIPLKLYVPEAAEGSIGAINVNLSYVDAYGNSWTETKTLSLSITSLGEFFAVEVSPETVRPEPSRITFTLINLGSEEAVDVEASLTLPAGLSLLGQDGVWRFSCIPPGGESSFTATLYASKAAVGSAAQANLTITYNAGGLTRVEVKTLGFKIEEPTVSHVNLEVVDVGWGSMANPIRAGPGDEAAPLYVALQNRGEHTVVGVKGELEVEPPFSSVKGEAVVTAFTPIIQPGQMAELVFPLDIAPDAEVKSYELKLKVSYLILNEVSTPPTYVEAGPVNFTLNVPLYGKPVLNLRAEPYRLEAGSLNQVAFTIENKGSGDIQDLNVSLQLPAAVGGRAPIALAGEDSFWHFDRLEAGSEKSFKVGLSVSRDAAGPYTLTFTLTYRDEWGNPYAENRSLGIHVSPKGPMVTVSSYSLEPEAVKVGETFKLKLSVENFGEREVHQVAVQLVAPQGFSVLTPSTISLGSLNPGESRTVEYLVASSPSAQEGVVYTFEVDISYVDSSGMAGVNRSLLGVPLHGIVELVTFDVAVSPTYPGGSFNLTFTLLNRGTTTAMYTMVSLVSEPPIEAAEPPTYVGDLDPNAPLPLTLKGYVSPEASEGTYPVKVKVFYKDEYHQPHTEYLTFQLEVSKAFTTTTPGKAEVKPAFTMPTYTYAIIGVVAVALAFLAFRKLRRKATV